MTQRTVPEALELAEGFYQARRMRDAEAVCREVLALEPQNPDAIALFGLLAMHAGNAAAAADLVRRAVALRPDHARYHNDLGLVLSAAGRHDDAIAAFRDAIALRPDYAQAYNNLGTMYRRTMRLNEAIAAYRRAVELQPAFAEAHYNLGNALKEHRLPDEAEAAYRKAIELRPELSRAYTNLAVVLKDTARLEESIALSRQSLEPDPDPVAASNLLCTLHYPAECDPAELFQEHLRWRDTYAAPLGASILPHSNSRDPDRRLRVGYVSPDFSSHPVGSCLLPVIAHHDHAAFKIFCYSDVARPDAMTRRLESYADVWRPVRRMSDDELSARIRADGIDVLVDLAVHTNENRLLTFARKPAPVQFTWLGWPGTTGLGTIDYRLSDPYLDPVGAPTDLYSEQTVRLPHSFWCYGRPEDGPAVGESPVARHGHVTFGCFNNFCKITPFTLDLWARVMVQTPGSRLIVLAPRGGARDRLAARLGAAGVDTGRVEFVDRRAHRAYLELYQRVDVSLDTLPYVGHTTSMDSFWMGVPVVTLAGRIPVWRAGLSICSNLGLTELVASTADEYADKAVALAHDPPRLQSLRATLRGRMESSPIMDGPRFAADVEAAYRAGWRAWCAGGAGQ